MKKSVDCPITIGDFNRLVKNLNICKKLSDEQYEWLEQFMDRNKYELKKVVLKLEEDNVLWVIINTENSVKEFDM